MTKGPAAIIALARAMKNDAGNLPPLSGIFPDYPAPIVRQGSQFRELAMARWGMPSSAFALVGKNADKGVTNIRNLKSRHWQRWLGSKHRCLVPFTSFSENEHRPNGTKPPVWFALSDDRPLAFFAGIWTRWKGARKVKEGPVEIDLFGFLACEPERLGRFTPKPCP